MKISPPPTPKSPPTMPVRKPARAKLMVAHRQPAPKPVQHVPSCIRTKVWVEREGRFLIGEGGIALLSAVAAHGSIAEGARQIGWSYRHAWGYLRRAEAVLGESLTVTRAGKGVSRGTALTDSACRVIKQLRDARGLLDRALGPSGPTLDEIAARGAHRQPSASA
jgi:molybdate transport system regulatory protein